MDYREKGYSSRHSFGLGNGNRRKNPLRFSGRTPTTKSPSRKIQIIKALVKSGMYETEEKMRVVAGCLLKILK